MGETGNRSECWGVVVVGTGLAGLYTALMLAKTGRNILLLAKTSAEESNTNQAQAGIAASVSSHDSPQLHMEDTILAGAGLCDEDAVGSLVSAGPEGIDSLVELGVKFDQAEDGPALTQEGAHSRRRVLHAGDSTGYVIRRALMENLVKWDNITLRVNTNAVSLIQDEEGCCGVACVDDQGPILYYASSVVLASGGGCQIYKQTTNPEVATGDGIAIAYRAGVAVRDMEFIQFHPTVLCIPDAPRFLISEAVRGEGALLYSTDERRFMPDYHLLAELAPRDVVARAIVQEMERTGEKHVWLDFAHIPGDISKRFPTIVRKCREYGIELPKDRVPVAPAAHYFIGGIVTDQQGKTSLPGLYACGEATCTGIHGANRLASNSLLEALVIGQRIAGEISEGQANEIRKPCWQWHFHDESKWLDVRQQLQQTMWENVGLKRDKKGLEKALEDIETLESRLPQGLYENRETMETANMLLLARLVAKGALLRRESRGVHYRNDYPASSERQLGHWVFSLEEHGFHPAEEGEQYV